MNTQISRMQFLRGDFAGRTAELRPPWALTEQAFVATCDRCGACVDRCPTRILVRGRGGFPRVDFGAGECLFCGDCVSACKPGALRRVDGEVPWSLRAVIRRDACLAFQGVECRSCSDPCEPRAIRMRPRPGGITIPEIFDANCTGCGACVPVCPAQAIGIQPADAGEAR